MSRVLSTALLAWFIAGTVFATSDAFAALGDAPAAAAEGMADGKSGSMLASGSCTATCSSSGPCAASNDVVRFPAPTVRDPLFTPALQFTDAARAPDTTPPKRFPV